MRAKSQLSVHVRKLTAYALVTATGSVERATRPVLIHHLNRALKLTRTAVIMDMSAVDYCDFSGLSGITHAFRTADQPAPALVLVDPADRLRRAVVNTALQPVYSHTDLDSAVRWLETGTPTDDLRLPRGTGAVVDQR
ncbi:MAG TPA: STAS domain-containing protein [Streptosporangiaceae bacterium]|nr:STAS domain-containing protein [Streptosporangiaceae bacterium]